MARREPASLGGAPAAGNAEPPWGPQPRNNADRRQGDLWRRTRGLLLSGAVGTGLALAQAAATQRPVPSQLANGSLRSTAVTGVQVLLQHAIVTGTTEARRMVQATLRDAGGGPIVAEGTALADEAGRFRLVLGGSSGPVRTHGGQRLLLADGSGQALDILLPAVHIEIDEVHDVVQGTAVPGATVWVTVDGAPQATTGLVADSEGRFAADLGDRFDITPGVTGVVRLARPDEAEFVAPWAAPVVRLSTADPIVRGVATSGAPLSLSLHRGGFTAAAATTVVGHAADAVEHEWSLSLVDPSGLPLPIVDGDHLAIESPDLRVEIEMPTLQVEANAVADLVTGVAPAGLPTTVRVRNSSGQSVERIVHAGADDRYLLTLAPDWDLRPGDLVQAECRLAEGRALLETTVCVGLLDVGLDDGRIAGYVKPGDVVRATLENSGSAVLASAAGQADEFGWFALALLGREGRRVLPQEGDEIAVSGDGVAFRVPVPLLTLETITLATVTGRAPAGGAVRIRWQNPADRPGASVERTVTVSASGEYVAELPLELVGISGSRIEASYGDASGTSFRRQWSSSSLRAQLGGSQITGQVAPAAVVSVSVARGELPVADGGISAQSDGTFSLLLRDAGGSETALQAGDSVRLQAIGRTDVPEPPVEAIEHRVIPIEARLEGQERRIVGRTAPQESLLVTSQADGRAPVMTNRPTSDRDGRFDVLVPAARMGQPFPAGSVFTLAVRDGQGMVTFLRLVEPRLDVTIGAPGVQGLAAPFGPLHGELRREAELVGTLSTRSDTFGAWQGEWRSPAGVAVGPGIGWWLSVTDAAGGNVTLVVPELTIALQPGGQGLRGSGPPGAILDVRLSVPNRPIVSLRTTVAADGQWSLSEGDLPPYVDFGWDEVTSASVLASIANGHRIVATTDRSPAPSATPSSVMPTPTATATAKPSPAPWRLALPYLSRLHPAP